MAALSELNSEGLLIAYYSVIKRQKELRAKQHEIEELLNKRYAGTLDKFKRGDIELVEGGLPDE